MIDFDKKINRRNTQSLKWDVKDNELSMSIADMDFEVAPEITKAFIKRVSHGIFGYAIVDDAWYDSYINWWDKRHDFLIKKEWMIFSTGIVPAISSIVRKLTTPAEKVLIQTPVYNIFFNSIINQGCVPVESELSYVNGEYRIDFDMLEKQLSDPQTNLMILCNPHNPIGKIWSKEELALIGKLCYKHNVTVISDEIHCDLTDMNCQYTPFASVNDICEKISITCLSPTKTFNLAGIQTACVVVPNKHLFNKVNRGLNTDEVAEPNIFAQLAPIVAFNECGYWLDELKKYIYNNKMYVIEFLKQLNIHVINSNATYLLWLDFSKYVGDAQVFNDFLKDTTGLVLSEGVSFGKAGSSFLRMNIACSRSTINDALNRLKEGLDKFCKVTL